MKKNKNILITGSSKGIGLSIAKTLSDQDHKIFITGRNKKLLEELCRLYSFNGFLAVDLYETNSENRLFEKACSSLGSIDILINNAGAYIYSPIEKTENTDITKLFRLNTEVPYLLSKLVIPQMKEQKWGRIINIGSISGIVGEGNASLYSTTKAALIGMTKSLALETAEFEITINTLNPGWVDTDIVNNEVLKQDFDKNQIIETIPQKRFVHPNEIAELCSFLISDNAKTITGQSINICAGLSIG